MQWLADMAKLAISNEWFWHVIILVSFGGATLFAIVKLNKHQKRIQGLEKELKELMNNDETKTGGGA